MDGFIGSRDEVEPVSWSSTIIEFENELGATSCDKYFQGQAYYAHICASNASSAARLCSSFPSFLVEIQGPYLRWVRGCWCCRCLIGT